MSEPAETAALEWIRRCLRGEIVGRDVGIRLVGGPSDGRTKIVTLDENGHPPERLRTRRGGEDALTWHVYGLTADLSAPSGWIYRYAGRHPDDTPSNSLTS